MTEHMLTTVDNPYNPWTHFDEWYAFDERAGYHSTGLLARIIITSDDLSDADQSAANEDAIIEIVKYNVLGVHQMIDEQGNTSMVETE